MERGGRRVDTDFRGRTFWCHIWDDERVLCLGFSTDSIQDAIMRCVRQRVKQRPACELATEYYRWLQRKNLLFAKKMLKQD